MHGRSLVPFFDGRGEHVPSNVAVVQEAMSYHRPDDPKNDGSLVWDRWHYLDSGKAPSVLFDHRSDLAETHPIRPSRSLENRARALFANLRQLDDELRRRLTAESSSTIEVDAANIANLEALGSLDDAAASGPSEAPRGDR